MEVEERAAMTRGVGRNLTTVWDGGGEGLGLEAQLPKRRTLMRRVKAQVEMRAFWRRVRTRMSRWTRAQRCWGIWRRSLRMRLTMRMQTLRSMGR